MKKIIIFLILSSCSPSQNKEQELPTYSDMGAAADAGKIK